MTQTNKIHSPPRSKSCESKENADDGNNKYKINKCHLKTKDEFYEQYEELNEVNLIHSKANWKTIYKIIDKNKNYDEKNDDHEENEVKNEVISLTSSFPIYKNL